MTDKTPEKPRAKALYHTFGCKLNFAETSTVARMMEEAGIERVAEGDTPDIIVVNTCSVTAEADRKCRSAIRSFHRRYPGAAIIVTGCYAQLKAAEAAAIEGVAAVAGINQKLDIMRMAEEILAGRPAQPAGGFPDAKELRDFMPSCSRGDRTRYFLKVQDGCDYWCSYCTIPKARGRSRSGTIEQLVRQAEEAAAEGGKEIVLTGVNIGDFGKGRDDTFLDLCMALDKVEGIERYRISSIEPNLLTDETIDFVASSRRFMPHFHVPLQSGTDEVLALMRRRYDTDFFARKMEKIKSAIPHAFIGVDLIVGARGETEELFRRSKAYVASLPVSHLHVFTYSERPGTRALDIAHIVSQEEKHRRTAEMLETGRSLHEAFATSFVGDVRPVLLEHSRKGHPMSGFTDNYLKIEVEGAGPEHDNLIVPVTLTGVKDDRETMTGRINL